MAYSTTKNARPLQIKFDIYSDSEDQEFKTELVLLMRGSILELQTAAISTFNVRDADIFRKAAHKAKSTLILLDDADLTRAVDLFKDQVSQGVFSTGSLSVLTDLCDSIADSLAREAGQSKA